MSRTPGLLLPSEFSSEDEMISALRKQGEKAGFTPFDGEALAHSDDSEFEAMVDDANDFFAHYGVKGMKWGVRKSDSGGVSGGKKAKPKEPASEDSARVSGIHSRVKTQRSTRMLSNKELQDAITRMNLEQQYSRLSGGLEKSTRQKVRERAQSFIDSVIGSGQQQGQNYVNAQVKDAIEKKTQTGRYDELAVAKRTNELNRLNKENREAANA